LAFVSWPSPCWPRGFTDRYDRPIQQAVKRWWPDIPVWKLWKAQLYQESRLDPAAVSPAGARGLAQFMPATWSDIARDLDLRGSPHDDIAIDAGAYYMAKLRQTWRRDRSAAERNELAQASYNAGAGNILKAQRYCGGARLWPAVRECLPLVTGARNAHETITYVQRIQRWWREMELTP
jgi:soluble lytic murein transglycosylase-like protein